MNITSGSPEVVIGLIDGPVDFSHPAFQDSRIITAKEDQLGICRLADSIACVHGTFVTGILASKRDSSAAAICPDCRFVLRPIFNEENSANGNIPASTPETLAVAILETIGAGARIINLSVGLSTFSLKRSSKLDEAYNLARRRGIIITAASGNQARIGASPMIQYPWIIPVAACDLKGKLHPDSNISPSIGRRGLMAPGVDITSTSPDGQYTQLSGTSVAAPFVTGTMALLWSEFPEATASEIRHAVLSIPGHHRRGMIPPLLNAEVAWKQLTSKYQNSNYQRRIVTMSSEHTPQELSQQGSERDSSAGEHPLNEANNQTQEQTGAEAVSAVQGRGLSTGSSAYIRPEQPAAPGINSVAPVSAHGSCSCGQNAKAVGETASFIYALGTIETPRFPNLSVEKEFAQAMQEGKTTDLTDREVIYNLLKENRYLALEVCWPFTIEGVEAYILASRDPMAVDQLIEAMKPEENRQTDRDVVIGVKGPYASPEMCNGLMVPIVIFDRIYSFNIPGLIESIPKPENVQEKAFRSAADDMFNQILQMADNVGAIDEHRALNYLVLRYPAIYSKTAEMYGQDFSLTSIDTRLSRLSVGRKIIDVIFTFSNRKAFFREQFFTSVDVTEKWPFLVRPLGLYIET